MCAKAFLPAGGPAVVPAPTYAMYRVITEQRGATVVPVRAWAGRGLGMDVPAVRAAAARAPPLVWLCSPNNPTGDAGARRARSRGCSTASLADAGADGRPAPAVVVDEAYAEFTGTSLLGLRTRYPEPDRHPDREQGLRPGGPAGRLRHRRARDSSRG